MSVRADERGWRQNFERAGFPGIDKEAAELLDFLKNGTATGTIVDLSCGSGLMTRRLVRDLGRCLRCAVRETWLRRSGR